MVHAITIAIILKIIIWYITLEIVLYYFPVSQFYIISLLFNIYVSY